MSGIITEFEDGFKYQWLVPSVIPGQAHYIPLFTQAGVHVTSDWCPHCRGVMRKAEAWHHVRPDEAKMVVEYLEAHGCPPPPVPAPSHACEAMVDSYSMEPEIDFDEEAEHWVLALRINGYYALAAITFCPWCGEKLEKP